MSIGTNHQKRPKLKGVATQRKHFQEVGIFRADAGSCNACDIEALTAAVRCFDVEGFRFKFVNSPAEASILVITGPVPMKITDDLIRVYESVPEPKGVVAVGTCAISRAVFGKSDSFSGPVDKLFPVDVYVPGCPPRPQAIFQGILLMSEKLLGIKKIPYHPTPAPKEFRGKPELDSAKCIGCGACAFVCPTEAITIADKDGKEVLKLDIGKCMFCAKCEEACPESAIRLTKVFEMSTCKRENMATSIEIKEVRCEKCGRIIGQCPNSKKY